MKTTDTRLSQQPHYLIMLKLYVQPDGSLLVTMGNQRMSVSTDEVHALQCGTLEYASVFKKLHDQIDIATLAVLHENNTVENGSKR